MTKRNERTETAAEAYARLAGDIKAQIEKLGCRLQIHEGTHRDRPTDWSLVGDLKHVQEILANAIEFLGSGR